MDVEVSCGAIIYKHENGKTKYVIIKSNEGFYGFPKGHMENGETEEDTAKREIFEEIGLKVDFINGFREIDEHINPKNNKLKRIIYFLANYDNQELKYQKEELDGVYLMDYDEAINSFQFESPKKLLKTAKEFLER